MAEASLTLLNTDGIHTWYQPGRNPSVLDLAFGRIEDLPQAQAEVTLHLQGTSDHAPILCAIPISFEEVIYRAIARDSKQEASFITDLAKHIDALSQIVDDNSTPESLERHFQNFTTKVSEAWNTASTIHRKTPQSKSWWNEACDAALRRLNRRRSPGNKKHFRKTVKNAKTRFFQERIDSLIRTKRPWDLTRWTGARKPSSKISLLCNPDGSLCDTDERWQRLHSHYTSGTQRNI
ncbi:hypothetical protein M378DRAFT_91760, partial [Amanita muscaria Koide BX008]